MEALPEPPDDAGPVAWPMPEFCPLTVSPHPSLDSSPAFSCAIGSRLKRGVVVLLIRSTGW